MKKGLIVALLFLGALALGQVKPAHPEMLVSTEWLANHLNDKKLVLVQIGPKESEYNDGHIPTARFLQTEKVSDAIGDIKHELLPTDQIIKNLEAIGISNNSRVVIYASGYPTVATRLYWTLDYLGIAKNASLLDGGIDKWKSENRPLSKEATPVKKTGKINPHLHPDLLANLHDVQVASENSSATLIDSRPEKRYTAGHIPGAVGLYWQQTVPTNSINGFLNAQEIKAAYDKAGIKPGDKIITYCETGFQATHSYFTLKYLGYSPSMYDGSFNEWNDVKKQPVVTGDKPK